MIITCPNCSAKFAVKAEAIGTEGRKVRCAKCKHDWFQDPPLSSALDAASMVSKEPDFVAPIPEGANLPVASATGSDGAPLYMKALLACFVVVTLVAFSITISGKVLPKFAWYYSMFGIHDDSNIVLENVTVTKTGEEGAKELFVKGRIVNEATSDREIPNLKIKLLSKSRKELREITLDSHGTTLASGEGLDFENKIQKLPEELEIVVMDIGNVINLAAR